MKGKAFLYLGLLVFMVLIGVEVIGVGEVYGACSSNPFQCDYVTRGGYDAAVEAWKRVSLLFSSGSQLYILFTIAFIVGLFFLFVSLLLKAGLGLRISFHSWFAFLIGGAILYLSLIIPKGKLVIYDEALNRGPYTVDNIPRVLVLVAGALNEIERRLVGLVGQSSDVVEDYRYNPAGIAFNALGSINAKQVPPYVYQTFFNYNKDCIITTASLENGVTFNDILSGRQSITSIINNSANPALFTVVVKEDGTTNATTCNEARGILSGYLGYDNLKKALEAGCSRAGYSPSEVVSFNQCRNMVSRALGYLNQNGTLALPDVMILQQMLFTEILKDYITLTGQANIGSYIATARTTGPFIGLGVHANAWIPELKEALQALVIAISPFVLLFVVTPFAGRALSLVVGFFLWLLVWGVIDAVVHSFGMSMAKSTGRYLATGAMGEGFGVYAAAILPNVTAKIYAIFGALRWSGLALASVMTTMLVRFGGAALTMVASQIASSPQASGAAIGEGMATRPLETVSSMITPGQAMANTAIQMGGLRPFLQGMVASEEGRLVKKIAGEGWDYATAKAIHGFDRVFFDLAYAGFHELRKKMAEGAGWREVDQAIGPYNVYEQLKKGSTLTAFGEVTNPVVADNFLNAVGMKYLGRPLTAQEKGFIWKHFGGIKGALNTGEVEDALAGLKTAETLYNTGIAKSFFADKRDLFTAPLEQRIATITSLIKGGVFGVKREADGNVMAFIKAGDKKGEEAYLVNFRENKADLVNYVPLQDLKALSVKVDKFASGIGIKDEKGIHEDFTKMLSRSDAAYKMSENKKLYERSFEKSLSKTLSETISQNEALRDAIKEAGVTEQQLKTYLKGELESWLKAYAKVEGGINLFGVNAKGGMETGSGLKFSGGAEAAGISSHQLAKMKEAVKGWENIISDILNRSHSEAVKNTLQTASTDGRKREELEKYAKEVGATKVLSAIKEIKEMQEISAETMQNIMPLYVRHLAKSQFQGDHHAAVMHITKLLASDEGSEKLIREMAHFAKEYNEKLEAVKTLREKLQAKHNEINAKREEITTDIVSKIPRAVNKSHYRVPWKVDGIAQEELSKFETQRHEQSKLLERTAREINQKYNDHRILGILTLPGFGYVRPYLRDAYKTAKSSLEYEPTDEERAAIVEGIVKSGGITPPKK